MQKMCDLCLILDLIDTMFTVVHKNNPKYSVNASCKRNYLAPLKVHFVISTFCEG